MMPHRAQGGSNDPASWVETRGVAALLTMGDWQRANLLTMRNACRANHFRPAVQPHLQKHFRSRWAQITS
jgi:hypothetical protein